MRTQRLRPVGIAAAVTAGIAVAAIVAPTVAEAGPLPGAHTVGKLPDGTAVDIGLRDHKVKYVKSPGATSMSRHVWASGKISVHVHGDAQKAKVEAGYLVGCQVTYLGSRSGYGLKGDTTGAYGSEGAGTVSIGPGETRTVPIITDTDDRYDPDNENYHINSFVLQDGRGGLTYSEETFRVEGCLGSAQAKPYARVTITTARGTGMVVLWGRQFSLGS